MPRRDLLQIRRGTAAAWTTANPILAAAEAGYETDTNNLKYGDGVTAWNALDYFAPAGVIDPDTTLLGNPITALELSRLSGVTSSVQTQINGKAATTHAHTIADVTSLQAALDAKANTAHTHTIADSTGLQAALDAKQDDFTAQAANLVFAGPANGAAAAPTFRTLVTADIPSSAVGTEIVVTAAPYSAAGDAKEVRDANISASSTTLTSATAVFTADDVGKKIIVYAAGATGGIGATTAGTTANALITTIAGFTNSTTVTLTASATTTVTNGRAVYGTDDTAAIQSALDDLENANGGRVIFPSGLRFIVSATLTIPRLSRLDDPRHRYSLVAISGYGAAINLAAASMSLFKISPATSYADETTKRFGVASLIEGLTIEGTAVTTQKAIDLTATLGATVRDLRIVNIGTGIDIQFAICPRIQNVIIDNATVYGIVLQSANGQLDMTTANTPTNAGVVDGALILPNGIASASIALFNCDQIELRNITTEKYAIDTGNPPYEILIDYQSIGYNHGINICNYYSEVTEPSTALIGVKNNGYVVIEKLRRLPIVAPIVDATGSVASTIVIRDATLTNTNGGASNGWILFKQDAGNAVGWTFENMGEIGRGETTNLVTNTALWVGGVIPARITQIEPGRIASAP